MTVRKDQTSKAEARHEPWGSLTWLASGPLLGCGGLTLGRVIIKTGQSNPRHRHNRGEEVLYLMAGRLRHSVGDQSVVIEAGDTLHIPAGVFHHAENIGEVDADMIVAYATAERDFELEVRT
jgi:quercetin dioxygenase-like cupin family protein